MRTIWGIPVKDLKWEYEDGGGRFDPDAVYPAPDIIANRVYCIDKEDESNVRVIQSYHQTAQPGAAMNFSQTVWGHPSTWEKPDTANQLVSCLGAPACHACMSDDQVFMCATAYEWRMDAIDDGDIQLNASVLESLGDPINEHLGRPHVMAEVSLFEDDYDRRRRELVRSALSLFGLQYDVLNAQPNDPSILAINVRPQHIDPARKAHYAARQAKMQQTDITTPMARLYTNR